jgi:hypothetical protein
MTFYISAMQIMTWTHPEIIDCTSHSELAIRAIIQKIQSLDMESLAGLVEASLDEFGEMASGSL